MCKKLNSSCLLLLMLMLGLVLCLEQTSAQKLDKKVVPSRGRSSGGSSNLGFLGFIIGPILFIMSFAGTWFNQKRAALNYRRLKLAQSMIRQQKQPQQINLDDLSMQLSQAQRLLHVTGYTEVVISARDEQFSVFPDSTLALRRKVEVKQMRSHGKRRSNQEEIQYKLQWATENIEQCQDEVNSASRWFITSQDFYSPQTRVSHYWLNEQQIKQLTADNVLPISPQTQQALTQRAISAGNTCQPILVNNCLYFPGEGSDVQSRGSLKVTFFSCPASDVSIVSSVDELKLTYQPFRIDLVDNKGRQDEVPCSDGGCFCCGAMAEILKPMHTIDLIERGRLTGNQMIDHSIKKNNTETNILRLGCFILMVLGICIFFSPVVDILGYIPLVGGLLKGTAGLIVAIGAFLVSIPMFTITMGLSWLRYHPMIGGVFCLFSMAVFTFFMVSNGDSV